MITVRFLYYNWFGIIPDDYTEGNKNMIQAIVLLVFLIFLNSVFAGAEMAVLSMNEAKMKELAEEGDHRAQILIKLTEQPAHFMTAIRVTVTTAGFLQSAFAAEYFAQPMTEALIKTGIDVPQNVLKIVCMIIVTILLSYVSLLFGELVPRRLGMKNPDELSLRLAGLLKIAMIAVWPATALLTVTANGVLYLMGIKPEEKEEQATEEEIRMLLTEGNEQGSIQQEERSRMFLTWMILRQMRYVHTEEMWLSSIWKTPMRNGKGSSERTVTPFIRYAGKIRMILSIFWTPEIISAWMTDPEKLFCIMPVIHRFLYRNPCVPT
mgnify:CR=1 FL=1